VPRIIPIRIDRRARNDLKIGDLRKIGQDIVLDSVGEVGLILFIAEILEGQDGDSFVDVAR
jgi:hypothetical protein